MELNENTMCVLKDGKMHVGNIENNTFISFCKQKTFIFDKDAEIKLISKYKTLSDAGVTPQTSHFNWCRVCWGVLVKQTFN